MSVFAQNKDSVGSVQPKKSLIQRLYRPFYRASRNDTNKVANHHEEDLKPYINKIVRNIIIRRFDFDQSFEDTTRSTYFGTKILNALHRNSREWVIRQNVFIREDEPFSAVLAVDNERYLRTLPFIRDARILVDTIAGNEDSIDLVVMTKDLFTINGSMSNLSPDRQKVSATEANLFGMGQSIEVKILNDRNRNPRTGTELIYTKRNIAGSFIDFTAATTTIGQNIYNGTASQSGYLLSLQRPLYSQYKRLAGAFTIGEIKTNDNYLRMDSNASKYNYSYRMSDGWFGFNLRTNEFLSDSKIHARQFLSFRYFNYHFPQRPAMLDSERYNLKFDNRKAFLAQLTLFKQDFFKTRYLYGFGVTEDVPYGYNISFTSGVYQQRDLTRPYIGTDANLYKINTHGDLFQYFARFGAYYKNGFQDVGLLLGSTMYSRLFESGRYKIRQLLRLSYSEIFNHYAIDELQINNQEFGLRRLNTDSITGDRRFSLHSETIIFAPRKVFGFVISPFLSSDISLITPPRELNFKKSLLYNGIGGGIRIRNENLILGTMELRCVYFPRKVENDNRLKIGINTNIRFRFNSNYVNAPNVIQMNGDANNSIY